MGRGGSPNFERFDPKSDRGWKSKPSYPTDWSVVIGDPNLSLIGDPCVFTLGGGRNTKYFALVSAEPSSGVFATTSDDGYHWGKLQRLWDGHTPWVVVEDDILRCYYVPNGPGTKQRTLRIDNRDKFLEPAAWSAPTGLTFDKDCRPHIGYLTVEKIQGKYVALAPGRSRQGRFDAASCKSGQPLPESPQGIGAFISDNGIDFELLSDYFVGIDDIPEHIDLFGDGPVKRLSNVCVGDWAALAHPRFLKVKNQTYFTAQLSQTYPRPGSKTGYHWLARKTFVFAIDFGPPSDSWILRSPHKTDIVNLTKWASVSDSPFQHTEEAVSIVVNDNASIVNGQSASIRIHHPSGQKSIIGGSFRVHTNYSAEIIQSEVVLPLASRSPRSTVPISLSQGNIRDSVFSFSSPSPVDSFVIRFRALQDHRVAADSDWNLTIRDLCVYTDQ